MAGITLNKYVSRFTESHLFAVQLKVTAVSTEPGLGSEIFVYHAKDLDVATEGDIFEVIASPMQMEDLPINNPVVVDDVTVPFYRLNEVSLVFSNYDQLEDAWRIIQEDTTYLIEQYRLTNTLELVETIDILPAQRFRFKLNDLSFIRSNQQEIFDTLV